MTDTVSSNRRKPIPKAFWHALLLCFIWINLSEVARFFLLIKPMLHDAFPNAAHIGAVTPLIFASWMVWDTILILAATGFYWMYLSQFGQSLKIALLGASAFTVSVFGLVWLGIVNMGLAPIDFIWAALPLAWIEQATAALLVLWSLRAKPQTESA